MAASTIAAIYKERWHGRDLQLVGKTDQPNDFDPYLQPKRLMDVLQTDIRRCGFLDNLDAAQRANSAGAIVMPHNWGSHTGFLMALHMAKAVKNIPGAEDDRSTCDVFITEGYDFHVDGTSSIPAQPGLSDYIDEAVYAMKCKANEVVVS